MDRAQEPCRDTGVRGWGAVVQLGDNSQTPLPHPPQELPCPCGGAGSTRDAPAWHPLPALVWLRPGPPRRLCPPPVPRPHACAPPQGAPTTPTPAPQPAVWVLLSPSPSHAQRHEYSYFLFKTNVECWLSEGPLITRKRPRPGLTDSPTWPLLESTPAVGGAADKGVAAGWLFMSD